MTVLPLTPRNVLVALAALAVSAVVVALLVAWSGFYNVAASRGHPAWLDWYLETGMRRSVRFHSRHIEAPDLDDPGLVALGAAHFQGGCAPCHGAPGDPVNPIYDHMLPSPPELEEDAIEWTDGQLFWIVRHGLQYAGMPAWSGAGRDREIWAVVAFLKRLPELRPDDYERLSEGNATIESYPVPTFAERGRPVARLTACSRCHDTPSAPPTSDLVPRLAGQSSAYLQNALRHYREDTRQSGLMEPIAADLSSREIERLVDYYASITSPPLPVADHDAASIDRGRRIATRGVAGDAVPPCDVCHDDDALPIYPRLAGQSAAYMRLQLALWRNGGRATTGVGELMATIATRLDAGQAADVSAYYQHAGARRGPDNATADAAGTPAERDLP